MEEQLSEQFQKMRGCIEVAMYNAKTGEEIWRDKRELDPHRLNAIARDGRAWNLDHMLSGQGATSQVLSDMAIGTDTTAPTTGDSGLGSEFFRKAVGTWDTSGLTANPPWFRAQIQYNTDEGNTTLAEAGLFNSNSGGTMMAHATYATTDKTTDNTFGITYTISN
jgi:hypothetical protein